jgi:adenylate cyclase
MDRIWQWAWDRYPTRYMWAICVVAFVVSLGVYLPVSFLVVAFEKSDRYVDSAFVTIVAVPLLVCIMAVPGRRSPRRATEAPAESAARSSA